MRNWEVGLLAMAGALLLFLTMILAQELGWRYGLRVRPTAEKEGEGGAGLMDNAVFGLLGLLIGFTFSGSAARFDHRRELVGNIVNTTGTAWQRIEALPPQWQDTVRIPLRRYVDALLVSYGSRRIPENVVRAPDAVGAAQDATWSQAMKACLTPEGEKARMLLLPALNEMFGAVEEERLARAIHPPRVIFAMLGLTALAAGFLAGFAVAGGKGRGWVHRIGVAATISFAVYVVLEMEFPRLGLVRVDRADQALTELRASMR
jgi:hypothetical protein